MPTPFTYLTWLQLQQQLAQKLNDTSNVFWTIPELKAYLTEALQVWNVLTQWWTEEYSFTLTPPLATNWFFTNGTGTPRIQTLTETDLYDIVCYHLMEPIPSTGVWQGTNQFTMNDLLTSAQQVRDEILQLTAVNMSVVTSVNLVPGTRFAALPDSILDLRRIRYTGAVDGVAQTLVKGDADAFLRFTPRYRQNFATPTRYDILGSAPLTLTVDYAPNQPNSFELLAIVAGNTLTPTSPQLLQIPNDWLFVLKWGVLADLLEKESESTDHLRADYAKKRYNEGLKLLQSMPWLLDGFLNNVAADIVPVIGKDRNSVNWQTNANAWPSIVVGGIDLIAPCPIPTDPLNPLAISLNVVANAPIPADDTAFVQAPRDVLDSILDYAQWLAAWKQSGDEMFEAEPLRLAFIAYAAETSARLRESGIFADDLRPSTSRQELADPRFAAQTS